MTWATVYCTGSVRHVAVAETTASSANADCIAAVALVTESDSNNAAAAVAAPDDFTSQSGIQQK